MKVGGREKKEKPFCCGESQGGFGLDGGVKSNGF